MVLACAVGVGLVMGFLWLQFAKHCTGFIVWTTILLVVIALGLLTGYFYYKAGLVNITVPTSLQDELNVFQTAASGVANTISYVVPQSFQQSIADLEQAYKVVAYVCTGVLLIVLAMIIALRDSIRKSVVIISSAAQALTDISSLAFFPFTTVAALLVLLLGWVYVAAALATSGDAVQASLVADWEEGLSYLEQHFNLTANSTALFLCEWGED